MTPKAQRHAACLSIGARRLTFEQIPDLQTALASADPARTSAAVLTVQAALDALQAELAVIRSALDQRPNTEAAP